MTEKLAEVSEDKESPDTEQETQEEATQEQPEKQEPEQEATQEQPEKQENPEEEPSKEKPEPQKKAEKPEREKPVQEPSKKKPEKQGPEKPKQAGAGRPRVSRDDNVVLVGKKPAMSYVMAVVTQFSGGARDVDIKARGRSISRAVDVAEVSRKRFLKELKYRIEIGTDEITDDQGSRVNVSTININLSK